MKYLITSDWHIGSNANSLSFFEYQLKVFNYIIDIYKDYKCDKLIIAGDFFDKRKNIDINIFTLLKDNFLDVNSDVNFIISAGNHDCYFRNTNDVNSLSLLKKYKNIKIVDDMPYKDNNMLIIPWVCDYNRDKINKIIDEDMSKYLICHIDINGAKFSKNIISQCEDTINRKKLLKYKKVFSGHYHIRSEKDNIMYVGTPHQLTWIDEGVEKYIYILDDISGELTELIVPFEMFKQIEIKEDNWKSYCNDDLKDKKVRIIYEDTFDTKLFNDIQTQFIQINPDIQFIRKTTPKPKEVEIKLDESKNLLDSILDYVKNIQPENQDKVESLIKKVYN